MGDRDRAERGEIVSLAAFLEEHCEAVEADLARFYPGEDLRDLFRADGRLTWRRLDVLLRGLPLESATQTIQLAAMTDEDFTAATTREHRHGPWSHTDLLLGAVVDSIERLTYVQLLKAQVKAEPPKPLPRPGVRDTARRVRAINPAAAAYLNGLRARGA